MSDTVDDTTLDGSEPSAPMIAVYGVAAPKQTRAWQFQQRVLVAARRTLLEAVSDEFTIAEVAAVAEVSVGGIYRRFGSKEGLLRAVKDFVFTDLEHRIDAAMTSALHERGERRHVLGAFVDALEQELRTTGQLYPTLLRAGDPVMADRGLLFLNASFGSFYERMREGRVNGKTERLTAVQCKTVFQMTTGALLRRASVDGPMPDAFDMPWERLADELAEAAAVYLEC